MSFLHKFYSFFSENFFRYRLNRSHVRISSGSSFRIGSSCKVTNSRIFVDKDSSLQIGENVVLSHVNIYVKGHCLLHDFVELSNGNYIIDEGKLEVDHHSKLALRRVWIRFGGQVRVGHYTNINERSEIRSDEKVEIGNYCQISYDVNIWDTNTHNLLLKEDRRMLTQDYFPYFGKELSRPSTKPVIIGDDCWIAQNATLLKGCVLEDEVIVGYGCLLSSKTIHKRQTVVSNVSLKIFDRE